MKATVEQLENDRVLLEIEVDEAEVEQALNRAYRKVVRTVNIPGFRKGKVPRRILEMQFGPEVLYEDALDDLIPTAYDEAVKFAEIEPIDHPDLDVVQFEAGKPFVFKAEVQLKPTVTLGDHKSLAVTRRTKTVTDEDVADVLEQHREQQAQLVTVEDRTVEDGDHVTIDFEGFVDGKPFSGGAASDHQLEIGSGQFIPGFEEQLIGAAIDEEVSVEVTFPEDYHAEELAGKDAVFKVTVSDIKMRQVPALDDELAKDVSDVDTLDEWRKQIRENLESREKERADNEMKDDLVEAFAARCELHLPDVLVDHELEHMKQDFFMNMRRQGITEELYFQITGSDKEALDIEMRPQAEERTKARLVMEALIESLDITVSDEDVDAEIDRLVSKATTDTDGYREWLNSPSSRQQLLSSLPFQRAIDILVDEADITDEELVETEEQSADDSDAGAPEQTPATEAGPGATDVKDVAEEADTEENA